MDKRHITFASHDARSVLVVVNPTAGARSGQAAVDQLVTLLEGDGFAVEVCPEIDRVSQRAAELLAEQRLRAVVAAGGDGTVGLAVNRTPPGTPIAVLPLGTENLLSKHLGIAPDPAAVFETIKMGAAVQLDAGRAGDRIFLLMASCGFDADVVRRLHGERHGHIHHLSYAKPILDSIRNYQYPEVRVWCEPQETEYEATALARGEAGSRPDATDGPTRETDRFAAGEPIVARWVFVMNLPRYAAGLQIVPDAVDNDGLLDVCTFKEGSLWSGLTYLAGVLTGQHQSFSDCVTRRARRMRIESDEPVPYQLDGDPGGFTPLDIEVVPGRLTLLAPIDPLERPQRRT